MTTWVKKAFDHISPYRPGKRISEVRRELGLCDIIKLSSNESAYPPVRQAVLAMSKAAAGLNRYPDSACYLLKNKLIDHLDVGFESLVVGNGSNELLRLLAQVVLEPGDEVVMASPSFIVYPIVADLMGAAAVKIRLKDFRHDLPAMADAVTDKTKLIFVCNPNNPTGTIVTADDLRIFMDRVPERVLVCFDEAYHEYVVDPAYGTAVELMKDYPNTMVLRTFSKIYGLAGVRVGYGAAPIEIVEAIDKVREPFNVNLLGQIGAYYSLDNPREIERRQAANQIERTRVQSALSRMGLKHAASQANFVYFESRKPAVELFEDLKKKGIIVRIFPDRHVRATMGTPAENQRFIEVLEKLV